MASKKPAPKKNKKKTAFKVDRSGIVHVAMSDEHKLPYIESIGIANLGALMEVPHHASTVIRDADGGRLVLGVKPAVMYGGGDPIPDDILSLFFDRSEFDAEEINQVISTLADVYHDLTGDELVIRSITDHALSVNLEPQLVF